MWLSKAATQTFGCFGSSQGSLVLGQRIKRMRMMLPVAACIRSASSSSAAAVHDGGDDPPLPPLDPASLEYEGNLVDGILFNKYPYFPTTWSLDDDAGRKMISRNWGVWIPPTESDIHRFFDEFYGQIIPYSNRALFTPPYRKVLVPYYHEMRNSWGFEVSRSPDYFNLRIIKPLLWDDGDTWAVGLHGSYKYFVQLRFIRAVQYLTALTGHEYEPEDLIRANSCRDLYLTFTARNMSTGVAQTFQALVRATGSLGDPNAFWRTDVYYMRLKPSSL
ncbi:hypothetical protein Tsubulata_019958 [Turnera subulata]|uniref:Uncharacterized protein n=1 Tax=Turnera subulata TaxID=218843 RepID=A0A9Q0GJ88_9ROSI|nr:hypothetical protein Tsubulata_019958 [Turnera subulata]